MQTFSRWPPNNKYVDRLIFHWYTGRDIMVFNNILNFLYDFAYEIVLGVATLLFMKFYSKIRFWYVKIRMRSEVDVTVWTTFKLKEPTKGEVLEEKIGSRISDYTSIPTAKSIVTYEKNKYEFEFGDPNLIHKNVTVKVKLGSMEVHKVKKVLEKYDYNTRRFSELFGIFNSFPMTEVQMELDRMPKTDMAGMSISSLDLMDGAESLRFNINENTISFKTDFKPNDLEALVDLVTFLYMSK